jgi:hypothetical protein
MRRNLKDHRVFIINPNPFAEVPHFSEVSYCSATLQWSFLLQCHTSVKFPTAVRHFSEVSCFYKKVRVPIENPIIPMPRTRSKQAWRLQLPTKLHYFKFAHHDNTINHRQQPTVTTTKITHAAQHNTTNGSLFSWWDGGNGTWARCLLVSNSYTAEHWGIVQSFS